MAETGDKITPPEKEGRRRGGCLTAYLIMIMAVNPLVALLYFFDGSLIREGLPDAPGWSIPVLGILCLFNAGFAVALWLWKKWGFWGFAGTAAVAFVVNIVLGLPLVQVLLGPVGVIILYAVLRPVWDELD